MDDDEFWECLEAHTEALYGLRSLKERTAYLEMINWTVDCTIASSEQGAEIYRLDQSSFRFSWEGIGLRSSWEEVRRSLEDAGRRPKIS